MVNEAQRKKSVVVRMSEGTETIVATAKGGCALVELLASRLGLWKDCGRLLPQRRDPSQGFSIPAILCALIHGLLAGGRGFSATEPMREDLPLQSMLGLSRIPSAETVEEVVKFLSTSATNGHDALSAVMVRQVERMLDCEKREKLMSEDGYVQVWGDGSLLETDGQRRDALIWRDGRWGQSVSCLFVGPYLAAADFVREVPERVRADGGAASEDERTVTARLLPPVADLLRGRGLMDHVLLLFDSLYGRDEFLGMLEGEPFKGSRYIVGLNGLVKVEQILADQPEIQWLDTTRSTLKRGWDQSAVCVCWIQCDDWRSRRLMVGRRFRTPGEMIWNYAGVATNLSEDDPNVQAMMTRKAIGFAEAVWNLYDRKQAMENQWKDLLIDMGLHRLPCAKAQVNAVFFLIAGLAFNLSVAARRLCMGGLRWSMRLWRFRREVIDLAARVACHARMVIVHLLDSRSALVAELKQAMARAALL